MSHFCNSHMFCFWMHWQVICLWEFVGNPADRGISSEKAHDSYCTSLNHRWFKVLKPVSLLISLAWIFSFLFSPLYVQYDVRKRCEDGVIKATRISGVTGFTSHSAMQIQIHDKHQWRSHHGYRFLVVDLCMQCIKPQFGYVALCVVLSLFCFPLNLLLLIMEHIIKINCPINL